MPVNVGLAKSVALMLAHVIFLLVLPSTIIARSSSVGVVIAVRAETLTSAAKAAPEHIKTANNIKSLFIMCPPVFCSHFQPLEYFHLPVEYYQLRFPFQFLRQYLLLRQCHLPR